MICQLQCQFLFKKRQKRQFGMLSRKTWKYKNLGINQQQIFLQLLGSIFTFVVSDVNEKIQILRDYRMGPDADQYVTIDKMMGHEIQHQLTKKSKPSGSRTLLRLHRAFEFVMDFIREMRFANDDARMSELTKACYDRTLAKFHPWLVRQGVYIAAYTLPRISQFNVKMKSKEDANSHMDRVLLFSKPVYDMVQDLYITNQLDNLS